METFTRLNRRMLLPMVFILPAWLIIRAFFSTFGWMTIVLIVTVIPGLVICLVILGVLLKNRIDFAGEKTMKVKEAILFTALYASIFLYGIFLVDYGNIQKVLILFLLEFLAKILMIYLTTSL